MSKILDPRFKYHNAESHGTADGLKARFDTIRKALRKPMPDTERERKVQAVEARITELGKVRRVK
jgi:hypothetical protein